MCGICGQYNFLSETSVVPEAIARMASAIVHRGPDDEGFYFSGSLGLGFRRLSIIDLAGGHQPMSDAEENVWVVFNGEIYNFKELRTELESRGHRFRTRSDTEVIVHGYKEWGEGVLRRLNGMFGLAIWDVQRRRLVVARDAMGIKLIYYRVHDGQLTFGSEIRAVLASESGASEVDPEALKQFFQIRYTPSPATIFRGVRKLAPGSMLIVEPGKLREERWYDYRPEPFVPDRSDQQAESELLELYEAAVQRHLLSDVPVGILLSGGLDSNLLLALMNQHGQNWPAYTVGYGSSFADDELNLAAESAKQLGAKHVPIRLDRDEFERSLPQIVSCLEEPITSSSVVPMYFVCERARQDVKVALIGQGPDELFGGYKRHLGVYYGGLWRSLPAAVRSPLSSGLRKLPRNETLKRGLNSLSVNDRLQRYESVFSLAPRRQIDALFREEFQSSAQPTLETWRTLQDQMALSDELTGFQLLELRSSLPDELLMYADKLSMAHSLEVRVPYLDRTVVEYAQKLGSRFMVRGRKGKWLHRKVCENLLDPTILRRKKRGFAVNVVDDWFKSSLKGDLPGMLLDEKSLMFDWLKPDAVRDLLAGHQAGQEDNHKLLFSLVMFEQWLRVGRSASFQPAETGLNFAAS
jgi:asparagine synthase (glutamine-hydrolysing)